MGKKYKSIKHRIISYTMHFTKLCIGCLFIVPTLIGCDDKFEYDKFSPLEDYSNFITAPEEDSLFNVAISACYTSSNYGKTVGVFGGSVSCFSESNIAKGLWKKFLNMKIKTYGKPGHGFSYTQGSIQNQVNEAHKHDIYILWASTNDLQFNHPIGNATDYSVYDNFDKQKRETQCGGINYCIRTLREKNPECTIYLFTSLKFFSAYGYGYIQKIESNESNISHTLYDYIEGQIACAQSHNIQYLNQWEIQDGQITPSNYSKYYKEDGFHLTSYGYFNIGIHQLLFLAQANK